MRTKGRLVQGYCESFCFIDVARGLPVALNTEEMSMKAKVLSLSPVLQMRMLCGVTCQQQCSCVKESAFESRTWLQHTKNDKAEKETKYPRASLSTNQQVYLQTSHARLQFGQTTFRCIFFYLGRMNTSLAIF